MKYRLFSFILIIAGCLFIGCSPKSASTISDESSEIIQDEEPTKQAPEFPCTVFDDLPASKRDQVETAYVLYRDLYKLGKYAESLKYWKVAYEGAPGSNGRVKYHFDDGIAIYKALMQTQSKAKQRPYVDTIMSIYDKRMECFGDEAYVVGRKAFDYYYSFPGVLSDMELYRMFKKNLDTKGKKADYFIVNPFTKLLYDGITADSIDYTEGLKYAKKVLEVIDYGTKTCKNNCEAWEIIEEYAPSRLETLEGIDGFYDCAYYTDKYYPMYAADTNNCELVELAYIRMLRGSCSTDDPKLQELQNLMNTRCYTAPPEPGPLRKAFDAYKAGDYKEAVTFFDEFVEKTEDLDKKSKYALLIGKIYYRDLKNYPKARTYARKAAEYRSNWGEPYMLIGKLYASSGPLCGPGRGWDSQIVTWPAIDQFKYAKSIDSEVAEEANKLIRQYEQYMPNKEDIFQRGIAEGSKITVGCWIQERTTVRVIK